MTPRTRAAILGAGYVLAVDVLSFAARGWLPSPHGRGWSADAVAEAPPLAHFDAGWYRSIATEGYVWDAATGQGNVVFFPLFPALARAASLATGIAVLPAATFLAHVFFAVALALLVRLADDGWGIERSEDAGLALVTFPWAFFLLAPYTESLFLALTLGAFLAWRRERWMGASALAFLAGLTRITALALVPPLLLMTLRRPAGARAGPALVALAPAVSVGSFLAWIGLRFRDPSVFFHAERAGWGKGPALSGIRSSLDLVVSNVVSRGFWHVGPALDVLVVVGLALAGIWLRKRDREGALYVASGLAMILAGGRLAGAGRYALVLFPIFRVVVALRSRRALWWTWLTASALLQAYLVVRFVNDLWVA